MSDLSTQDPTALICPFGLDNDEARFCKAAGCALWINYLEHPQGVPGSCAIKHLTGLAADFVKIYLMSKQKISVPFDLSKFSK